MRLSRTIVMNRPFCTGWFVLAALLSSCGSNGPSRDREAEPLGASAEQLDLNIPPPEQTVYIDLEGPGVAIRDGQHLPNKVPPSGNMRLDDDNKTFFLPLGGSIEAPQYVGDRPYVNPRLFYGGGASGHSLQLTLPPRIGNIGPDRVEVDAVSTENSPSGAVVFDTQHPKWFGFAIYIHPSTTLPLQHKVHFMQAWQDGVGPSTDTATCGVPLVGTLQNAGNNELDFYFSSHNDGGGNSVLDETRITLGTWHTFLFYLKPDTNEMTSSTGKIQLWFDGVKKVDWDGDWGCNISSGQFLDRWDLRVGMYRPESGPEDRTMYMFLDNIGVASFANGADPRPVVVH